MQLKDTEFRIGTFHGRHDGVQAKVTAIRDATLPEPYFWICTCGASWAFLTEDGVFPTAWRHPRPTRLDRLWQWTTRRLRFRTRAAR